MSKSFLNLFIILIACIGLSVIPINSNILNMDIKTPANANGQQENEQNRKIPIFAMVPIIPDNSTLTEPKSIDFEISASDLSSIKKDVADSINVTVLKDESTVSTLSAKALGAAITLDEADPTQGHLSIPLSYAKLGLISGYYRISVESLSSVADGSAASDIKKSFSYNIVYADNKTYFKVAGGQSNMALVYYPDDASHSLIPVTKIGYYPRTAATSIGKFLSGALSSKYGIKRSNLGLFNCDYTLEGSTLTVNFNSKTLVEKGLSKSDNTLHIRAIASTALANPLVNEVVFKVDDMEDITILNTTLTSNRFTKDNSSKLFIGLVNEGDYLYMTPYAANSKLPDELFNELKSTKFPALSGNVSYINPIPSNVSLLGYKEENKVLTLDLDGNAMGAFGKDVDYISMMIDAISQTMMSTGQYTRVQFTVDGKIVKAIGDYAIPPSLAPSAFINPVR
jgi:hypothetical protein